MDEHGWFVVLSSRELRRKPLAARRLGRDLVFWRAGGGVHALEDVCPHRRTKLSLGRVTDDGCLECPFHGFRFAGDGACTYLPVHGPEGPIPKKMRATPLHVREAHGFIWMWGDRTSEPVGEPGWFDDLLDERFSYAELVDEWSTHWSRSVENQLDFVHLPFVHETTIGKGMAHQMEPRTEVGETAAGQRFIRGYSLVGGKEPPKDQYLEWREPNVWILRIAPQLMMTLAFVPIDEGRTRLYLRNHQSFVRVPLVRDLVGVVGRWFNRRVLNQDKAVVEAQSPGETRLGMDEVLLPSDSHIIAFRRWREERRREREARQAADSAETEAPVPLRPARPARPGTDRPSVSAG